MENLQCIQQGGGEKHQHVSDKHFEEFFDCDVLDIFQVKEELTSGSIEQDDQFISFYDTSDSGSNSYENNQEDSGPPIQLSIVSSYTQLVPILNPVPKKSNTTKPKKSQMIESNQFLEQLNFDPETGTLSCKFGVFQHLQYLFPEHPLIIQTKNDDKWSRINEAVRKYLTKAGENKSFISISPKGEHSEIYKLIKELKFLKQRNSYLLIAIDKKDHLEKYLDQRWNNKRNTKKRKNSEDSEEEEIKEKQKKIKKDQPNNKNIRKNSKEIPVKPLVVEVKQEIKPSFHNLFARVDRSVVIIKNQQKASCIKVSLEGSEHDLPNIVPLISPNTSFYDKSIEPKKDLPHYLLSSSQLKNLREKKLSGDFKDPFDTSKLEKLGVNPHDKGSWLDFVEKFVGLPKLCESESFDLSNDLSQFSLHLIQFFDLLSSKKKSFDSVVIKGVSSSVFQVLRISGDLSNLVEKLLSIRKQAKICLANFGSYEDTSKLISEEYLLRVEVSNNIKHLFDYLVRGDNQLPHGKYFFEEYIVNFSVCGSCLLIKDDKVEILGNFDEHNEEVVSPSRFFQDILSKTSLEIGKSFRLFLSSSHSSFFVTLRFYSSNLSLSQLFLRDIEVSFDQNLLPLSFVLSPSLQREQFLFVSHYYHQGNVADLLLNKFPLHFDQSSFPHIHPQINRVLFIPQQNLTRIDYSLVLESERFISLSSSSFKQILTTIL